MGGATDSGLKGALLKMAGFKGEPAEDLEVQAFVAFKPKCGHAVAVAVIRPEYASDAGVFVVESEKSGLIVEIRSVKWARANLNICSC